MAEVKVLIEGDTKTDTATITLIKDGKNNIIVDPGILASQKILVDRLRKEGLSVDDINIVFITHSHIDHYRNIGMFPGAKTLEHFGLWDKNIVKDWPEQFSDDIRVIRTPGHNYDALTFLVKTSEGIIAICGDVFWKKDFPEVEDDVYASNKEELKKSRKTVLALADWIIPGHAGMFKAGQ